MPCATQIYQSPSSAHHLHYRPHPTSGASTRGLLQPVAHHHQQSIMSSFSGRHGNTRGHPASAAPLHHALSSQQIGKKSWLFVALLYNFMNFIYQFL
jgi:hypothetical protein